MTRSIFTRRRGPAAEHPVELRFVDMLLIIIATLMFVAILLGVVSAVTASGRPDVAPRVLTQSVPAAIAGQSYQLTLAATGGDGEYVWTVVGGALPEGLSLDQSGVIEGTPAKQQTSGVSVQVSDGTGRASEARELSVDVRPTGDGETEPVPPRIADTTALLPEAVAGQAYQFKLAVEGGGGYSWQVIEGAFPGGVELSADGTLAGRPDAAGTYTVAVAMTGADGVAIRQTLRLAVADEPESLLWKILGWIKTIVTWAAYLLLAVTVIFIVKVVLFGLRGGYQPDIAGVFTPKGGA